MNYGAHWASQPTYEKRLLGFAAMPARRESPPRALGASPDPQREAFAIAATRLPDGVSVNQHERPAPARLGEEVLHQVDEMADGEIDQIFGGRFVRPVDQKGFAFDVFGGHEAPIAAVGRVVAI